MWSPGMPFLMKKVPLLVVFLFSLRVLQDMRTKGIGVPWASVMSPRAESIIVGSLVVFRAVK